MRLLDLAKLHVRRGRDGKDASLPHPRGTLSATTMK
jgi:hypothetical protein